MKAKKEALNAASAEALEKVTGAQNATVIEEDAKTVAKGADTKVKSELKEEVVPKNVFNTKKAAELVGGDAGTTAGVPGVMLKASGRIRYSGGADFVGGDYSATTKGDITRKSGDRPGRQIDTALMHIDDSPAETFTVPIDTIPMIDQGASNVGYNGKYRNAHAVSQKGSGGSPADSDFFRTLDEVQFDQIYFGEGQINSVANDAEMTLRANNFVPQHTKGGAVVPDDYSDVVTTDLGNYAPQSLEVVFDNSTNKVSTIALTEENIANVVTEDQYRMAGDSHLRHVNINENDRLAMINEAGDETKENWSPLGRVLPNASGTNRILKEADLGFGDQIALSYAKLSSALAYQNNKAAKDGLLRVGPMHEMCKGNVPLNKYRSWNYHVDNETAASLFGYGHGLNEGNAALFVAINDSTSKYTTKGKLLSLPLSFKSAISSAKQNIGGFKMHDEFYNEFIKREVFGKVDEDGSGLSPYFISDGALVTSSIPLFHGASIVGNKYTYTPNATTGRISPFFTAHYEDLRNKYNIPYYNYFVQGLVNYFNRYGSKIVTEMNRDKPAGSSAVYTLTIPVTSTTTCLSAWDILLCYAAKDIAIERKYALDLVLRYESLNGHYPYSGAKQVNPDEMVAFQNIGFIDISSPLSSRVIPLQIATRLILPEILSPIAYSDSDKGLGTVDSLNTIVVKTIMPWYFNQNAFEPTARAGFKGTCWCDAADGMANNTYFDFRGGVSFGNADRIKAMDPELLRLSMDRMITMPAIGTKQCLNNTWFETDAFKFSFHEDGIPCVNYLSHQYSGSPDTDLSLTILDVLKTPRELGLSFIAPAGVVTPTLKTVSGTTKQCDYRNWDSSYFFTSGPSFRIRYWHAFVNEVSGQEGTLPSALFAENRSSDVAYNFSAMYNVIECTPMSASTDIGLKVTANKADGSSVYAEAIVPFVKVTSGGTYNPTYGVYTSDESIVSGTENADLRLYSAIKSLYARVQMLPFVINPFDSNAASLSSVSSGNYWTPINSTNPFDFLQIYNMCGFRAGEYAGTTYDRNKARIELGLGYVEDPYIQRML